MRLWLVALVVVVCASAAEPVVISGRSMGTTWTAKFIPADRTIDTTLLHARVGEELERLERIFSTYRYTSTLSRFNAAAATEWFPVESELVEVAHRSSALHEMTRGAFDPSVAPLLELWGFGSHGGVTSLPNEAELAAARRTVGWNLVEIRTTPPALRKVKQTVRLDFSSIAKGFAVDRVSDVLTQAGVQNCLVQLAGDMKARGNGPNNEGWLVGIEVPRGTGAVLAARVVLRSGMALSTSGNYLSVIRREGRELGHIIDPRSGRPVESSVAAVSVVATECATSSALATGLFVLGVDAGLEVARTNRLGVLFQLREGEAMARRSSPEFDAITR